MLYVPEPVHNDPNSDWRKQDLDFLADPRALKRQREFGNKAIAILTYINIFLCAAIFIGIIKLLFFTNYETVYIDDGTYHSCVIENGVVKPYEYK